MEVLLAKLDNQNLIVDVVLIYKTFLKDTNQDLYKIDNYNFFCKNRQTKIGGGVGIYVRDIIKYTVRGDISVFIEGVYKSLFLELDLKNRNKHVIGEIHRLPNSKLSIFHKEYNKLVDKVNSEKNDLIVGTDQNLDYLKILNHKVTSDFFDTSLIWHMLPTVTKPTRIS